MNTHPSMLISVDQLRIPSYHSWHYEAPPHIPGSSANDDLAASIRHVGLLTPLTVVGPQEDGSYEIISGTRRYRAILAIRKTDPDFLPRIPCYVVGDSTMPDDYKRLLVETANLELENETLDVPHRFQLLKLLKCFAEDEDKTLNTMAISWVSSLRNSIRYSGMCNALFGLKKET